MRLRLTIILLVLTAFSAAAQFPVKSVSYYPSSAPAELRFVDGNVGTYPIMRITNDLIRVDSHDNQSMRMPLTYLESIRFADGCTMFFENGVFQFDKLVQPALLKNEGGDPMLQGVLKLNNAQAGALMGAEAYRAYRKNSRLLKIGVGTIAGGTILSIPYLSTFVLNTFKTQKLTEIGGPLAIAGGSLIVSGLVMYFIGNSQCNRIVATYNNGLGMAYTF